MLGPRSGGVVWCYICVRCESGLAVLMAGTGICVLCLADTCVYEVHTVFNPGHPMEICFLTCICLWQISQIQTRLFNVVGPAFVRSSVNHPAGLHGRFAPKQ